MEKDEAKEHFHGFQSRYLKWNPLLIQPRVYSTKNEKIHLDFLPIHPEDVSENWIKRYYYRSILTIFYTDYRTLLIPYFNQVFIDEEGQPYFEECFCNIIHKKDWLRLIDRISKELLLKSEDEQLFYRTIIEWIQLALLHTETIIVDGTM